MGNRSKTGSAGGESPAGSAPTTVGRALSQAASVLRAAGCPSPRLDAELLLVHVTGFRREDLLTHPERALSQVQWQAFATAVERRRLHCPVAYITGRREFAGLVLEVTPDTLIPRPETELLVETAVGLATKSGAWPRTSPLVLADVGTGSGAVALALARLLPGAHVLATDISAEALAVATRNARTLSLEDRVTFLLGSLLEPLDDLQRRATPGPVSPLQVSALRLDGVVANLPYVAEADWSGLESDIRLYEPRASLVGGPDGLDLYRDLAGQLAGRLIRGGFACLEIGPGQGAPATVILSATGLFDEVEVIPDLAGRERVAVGCSARGRTK